MLMGWSHIYPIYLWYWQWWVMRWAIKISFVFFPPGWQLCPWWCGVDVDQFDRGDDPVAWLHSPADVQSPANWHQPTAALSSGVLVYWGVRRLANGRLTRGWGAYSSKSCGWFLDTEPRFNVKIIVPGIGISISMIKPSLQCEFLYV